MEKETKKIKPLVTSRVLFISALDKIYLIILLLTFIALTIANFAGDISSIYYGFWARIGREIVIIIIIFLYYLLLNWFYKCAAKTMLCLTKNEVYKEIYIPFKRTESSIPLNKITKVTTHEVFWIFRTIVIHQYGKLPVIFFTWNNQEFKDKLNELITTDKQKIENEYEDKNIISKDKYKYLKYIGIILSAIICLIGIVKLFNFVFNKQVDVSGRYTYSYDDIVLYQNGTCNIDDLSSKDINACTWSFNEDTGSITIDYEYETYSYYSGYTTKYDSLYMRYNFDNNTLIYDSDVYQKNR